MNRANKVFDLSMVFILIVMAAGATSLFGLTPVFSWVAYYVPASLFLWARRPKSFFKVFSASVVAGLLLGPAIDVLASYNGVWTLDVRTFDVTVLGVLPVDDLVWWFLSMFFIFTFYEHFLVGSGVEQPSWKPNRRLTLCASTSLAVLLVLLVGVGFGTSALILEHFYVKIGILITFPILIFLVRYPAITARFLLWSLPFFFINLLMEIVGVRLGHWSFRGDYVGSLSWFGATFPAEELVFWMILSTPVIFAWYRTFIDTGEAVSIRQ